MMNGKGKLETVSLFYRQMSVLLNAGVPLVDALDCLSEQEDYEFADIVIGLTVRVSGGASLSHAMSYSKHYFDGAAIGLIGAAEESGAMVTTFEKLADVSERTVKIRKMVITALTYPAIQALAIIGVIIVFVTFIAPGDSGLFAANGEELPWPSQVLVDVSAFFSNPFHVGFSIFCIFGWSYFFHHSYKTSTEFQKRVDRFLIQLPMVGNMIVKYESARICYTMETTMVVGLPILKAVALAERVAGNRMVKRKLQMVRADLREGEPVGEAFSRGELFSPLVLAMMEVGQQTGRLDEMLRLVSQRLDEDVENTLLSMVRFLEPLLLGIAGVAAGFVAVAALLPLLEMINKL